MALLQHLSIRRCHVMGACIGVSFAYSLAEALPGCVTALVLQNPIGLANNRDAVQGEYEQWAAQVRDWPNVDASLLPDLGRRMFGGDFITIRLFGDFFIKQDRTLHRQAAYLIRDDRDLAHNSSGSPVYPALTGTRNAADTCA